MEHRTSTGFWAKDKPDRICCFKNVPWVHVINCHRYVSHLFPFTNQPQLNLLSDESSRLNYQSYSSAVKSKQSYSLQSKIQPNKQPSSLAQLVRAFV